ncbi:MAG TPA: DUF5916 domain-containing protein [Thermoanaerobaculia bacterium]|nr:DUF5916 domain-containing protein [Thermoanaerobaculia bacterium]
MGAFARLAACFVVLSCPALIVFAQQADPGEKPGRNHFPVAVAASDIAVDGSLSETAWEAAAVVPLTHEWLPGDNTPPPVATECLVTFDNENLYVGFRAHDPEPGAIRAYLADRDTAFNDDAVGFMIDTFNDRRRAFEFRVNPLGVQMEATVSDVDATEDFSWDAIWDSAGRITADGYEVEIAVPWKQLRFPRGERPQTWGFLALRAYPRSVLHQLRSTRNDRSLDCLVCQFDSIEGFQRVESGYNLEVVPTVTAKRTDERSALDQPLTSGDEEFEAGVSVRWAITPNVALNAAVNPDFSQVEADVAQLNVNERFALFFPEKRPFFLEGADFFATPYQVVFTRTVADPKVGLKLTGKEGSNAFGVFAAEDRINNLIFPGAEESGFTSLDEDVRSAVVRWRRDIGKTSTLGVLLADREGDGDYFNRVYGLDGSLRPTDADTIRFQAVNSETRYDLPVAIDNGQPLDDFSGPAWRVDYSHATRNWAWDFGYNSRDPEFRADSGFLPQVDIKEAYGQVVRTVWGKEGGWFSRLLFEVNTNDAQTFDGDLFEQSTNVVFTYEGPLQSFARLGLRPNKEGFRDVEYDNFRRDLLLGLRPSGNVGLQLFLRGGEIIDFNNARQAEFELIQPTVDFRIGRHVQGSLDHTWQVFDIKNGPQFQEANLTQGRLLYHFNVRTFVRLIVQYLDVQREVEQWTFPVEPEEETLFTQFLFSYKLNPQTVLLVGYSDDYEGTVDIALRQRDRAFFVKVGYAWLQ